MMRRTRGRELSGLIEKSHVFGPPAKQDRISRKGKENLNG
jgi:hypothetical protein